MNSSFVSRTGGLALGALLLATQLSCHAADTYRPLDGDIIFHTSRSAQSPLIQLLTDSPFSHVGIVYLQNGQPLVFEAVEPVRSTPLAQWVARGEGGHFVVRRLIDRDVVIDRPALQRMLEAGRELAGRHYDLRFAWSDERLYCSELVWKIYHRGLGVELAELQRFADFDLDHPAVREAIRDRFGSPPPGDEPVVTPAALFASKELSTVFTR